MDMLWTVSKAAPRTLLQRGVDSATPARSTPIGRTSMAR